MGTEEDLNRTYQVGISAGLGEAAKFLRDHASRCFINNRDEEARLLRGFANTLDTMAKEKHPGAPE